MSKSGRWDKILEGKHYCYEVGPQIKHNVIYRWRRVAKGGLKRALNLRPKLPHDGSYSSVQRVRDSSSRPNIFLSKVNSSNPVIKLGDLGHSVRFDLEIDGRYKISCPGELERQPTVAKIIRLCGDIELPPDLSPFYNIIRMGAAMVNGGYTSPRSQEQVNVEIKTRTLREELESLTEPIDPGCIDFLEYVLNVDPDQRPSAREALEHPWL
ncbi:hypothetical protein BKA64DRAFT_709186 [Cadophora sp. MPI-SDFR-AT-0126]|nr:hypothetical protein BKA64DRAFT_709186 [Leotiomycetes sp. MPI-SDFR-AT-0126]